jgi:hypothetical protein
MIARIYILLAVQLFSCMSFVLAQNDSLKERKYVEYIPDYLTSRIAVNNDIRGFGVRNTVSYDIMPNTKNVLKISANYKWFSFSASQTPAFLPGNNDDKEKGSTKNLSFALNLNFKHWMQHLSFNRVKGYYLENTKDFRSSWRPGDVYIQFPDLYYRSYLGHTAYKFNKNFSYNALATQSERQVRSAGSIISALTYNFYFVDDRTPLSGQHMSQKSNNLELLLSTGYTYNVVIRRNFYVAAGIHPGIGLIKTKVTTRNVTDAWVQHHTNPLARLELNGGAGFNGKRFFTGLQFNISSESYREHKTPNVIVNDRVIYQAFLGYRFTAPKKLKQAALNMEEKMQAKMARLLAKKAKTGNQ